MKSLLNSSDKEKLLRRLRQVQPDSPRRWGKMSAHQMVCHLNDSFKMAVGERPIPPAGALIPGKLVKWLALYVPIPWPHGVPTVPDLNQDVSGTKPMGFETDVRELEMLLERMTRLERDFKWGSHPVFGSMPGRDWLRLGYLHMDHHLRQFGV